MRDLPFFATEYGLASLTLREIPYTHNAYIKIQSTQNPKAFLEECRSFCRGAGAEHIYASGHAMCESYPFHTSIFQMRCLRSQIPDTDASLFPVTDATVDIWRQRYNEKAVKISNAAWMTDEDGKKMIASGDGYFVHRNGELLGIGRVTSDSIRWVASFKQGAGADVLSALTHASTADTITLEVASANGKAICFYEKLGFVKSAEISKWYKVL